MPRAVVQNFASKKRLGSTCNLSLIIYSCNAFPLFKIVHGACVRRGSRASMNQRILFLIPYPLKKSPSQRFRIEHYFPLLQREGFHFEVSCFLQGRNGDLFSSDGRLGRKILSLLDGFLRRCWDLFRSPTYDYVFIHREAAPIGPPILEWLLRFVLRKRIIYDFDDAIWVTDKEKEHTFEKIRKWRSKVKLICRWSYKVSVANEYLSDFAGQFNHSITILPTTIDTERLHNPALFRRPEKGNEVIIGWTGSRSTLKYLYQLEKTISEIEGEYPYARFLVIADQKPSLTIPSWDFIRWNPETEIQDLTRIDIGVMPLPDDDWAKGKGGFKCLQYMALEIPAVASNVGVNSRIVDHGHNGFLAFGPEDWLKYLKLLITDKNLRQRLGAEGRKKVINDYSVIANSAAFCSLFR